MSEERQKILQMLADGKINVAEAESLLSAIGEPKEPVEKPDIEVKSDRKIPKYLYVTVRPKGESDGKHGKVNVRVPLQLLRAGVKLASLMPKNAEDKVHHALHEHGINFDLNNIKPDNIDEILIALQELSIDVEEEDETVKIYCE
ncbi:MAG: hypothetical protein GF307_00185 [candidate division Zixibacteria bacterium]|nr:hypothetical protein [candidate division Zixibacteria bacterium]